MAVIIRAANTLILIRLSNSCLPKNAEAIPVDAMRVVTRQLQRMCTHVQACGCTIWSPYVDMKSICVARVLTASGSVTVPLVPDAGSLGQTVRVNDIKPFCVGGCVHARDVPGQATRL